MVPVTYSDAHFECNKITQEAFYASLAYKRTAFSHEKEVRLIKNYKFHDTEDAELHIKAWLVSAKHPKWVDIFDSIFPVMELEEKATEISKLVNQGIAAQLTQDVSYAHIPGFIAGVMVHPLAPNWFVDIVKEYCASNNIPFDGKSELYCAPQD